MLAYFFFQMPSAALMTHSVCVCVGRQSSKEKREVGEKKERGKALEEVGVGETGSWSPFVSRWAVTYSQECLAC